MKPGPPRKPTNLRLLEGNPSGRPLPLSEPKPRRRQRLPSPPTDLGEEGVKEWRRVGTELMKLGLLTTLDITALHMYCDAAERWRLYAREARRGGAILKTPNGWYQQNPYVGMANTAFKQAHGMLAEFGLTPAARARLAVDPVSQEDDELANWLYRRGDFPARFGS